MKKANIYAIVFGRCVILLIGFVFLAPFFLLYILGQIAEQYLTSLFAFVTQTKTLIANFDHELNSGK